ncbi:MAG TPA: nuclear transport factor 2 family protein [Roseiarcus sp.]
MNENHTEDEREIRGLIEAWAGAVRRGDIDAILQHHAPDFVMFDVPPPFEIRGLDAYRKSWDLFFSWSSNPIPFEIHTLDITAGADVAFAVATMGCAEPGPDGEPKVLDFRLTVGFRKINGAWTITHEHHSVPAVD